MNGITVGAVIVAGGLSSRMNDYKPLMKIGNTTMIEMTICNFRLLGIDEIVVVTGYKESDLKQKLTGKNIKFIHNYNYETTQMFDSIRLGLMGIEKNVDLIFITPADSPFVQQFTLKRMIDMMLNTSNKLIQPSYDKKNGHPLLMRSEYLNMILKHDRRNGMQGVISNMKKDFLNITYADPGIILDADTIHDYKALLKYNENKGCPSVELCKKIQDYFKISDLIKAHSDRVVEVALIICQKLSKKGIELDKKLIVAASMLHDIAKGNSHHAEVGANWIMDMGYKNVSKIVREHMELNELSNVITEKEVVYLADKLVIDDRISTIEQRFSFKEELYRHNEIKTRVVEKRKQQAMFLYNEVFGSIDFNILKE